MLIFGFLYVRWLDTPFHHRVELFHLVLQIFMIYTFMVSLPGLLYIFHPFFLVFVRLVVGFLICLCFGYSIPVLAIIRILAPSSFLLTIHGTSKWLLFGKAIQPILLLTIEPPLLLRVFLQNLYRIFHFLQGSSKFLNSETLFPLILFKLLLFQLDLLFHYLVFLNQFFVLSEFSSLFLNFGSESVN